MAGDWIKVERATPEKPEVLRMARELCIDRDAVFGKVMLVWMWFDSNSCNGVVDGAVDADVDAVVRHQGFASLLRSVGWLKDAPRGIGLELPNFARHNGETAKKRALSNRRQAKWRNAAVDGHVDAMPSTNASTREEKRREEIKTKAARAVALPEWLPHEAWKDWLEVRSKAKAPNTHRALTLALGELSALRDAGNDPKAVLERATVKGWKSLYPVPSVQSQAIKVDA
jgi:hypothetical protein